MKIDSKDLRVQEGEKLKLKKLPTLVKPVYQSKVAISRTPRKTVGELSALQQRR